MAKTLLNSLPEIIAAGKRHAAQILEQLEGRHRVTLQTREIVIPGKDRSQQHLFAAKSENVFTIPNRLIYGDNLLAMTALLSGELILMRELDLAAEGKQASEQSLSRTMPFRPTKVSE